MCSSVSHCFCVDSDSFSSPGGPPYPPNQYGGGRGNYDNFRGQGGYLGKPRNIRWDHCTCNLYFVLSSSTFCHWIIWNLFLRSFLFSPGFLFLSSQTQPSQNVTRWSTQHHWIPWPGCARWHGLLLKRSLGPFSLRASPMLCPACLLE